MIMCFLNSPDLPTPLDPQTATFNLLLKFVIVLSREDQEKRIKISLFTADNKVCMQKYSKHHNFLSRRVLTSLLCHYDWFTSSSFICRSMSSFSPISPSFVLSSATFCIRIEWTWRNWQQNGKSENGILMFQSE